MLTADDVEIVHFIPGRVRMKVKALKTSPQLAERIQTAFGAVPAVREIHISSLTGSVLLTYDTQAILLPESLSSLSEILCFLFPSLDVEAILRRVGAPASS